MTSRMALALKSGQMVLNTPVSSKTTLSMDKVYFTPIKADIRVNFNSIIFKVLVLTIGTMAKFTRENGFRIKNKAMASKFGLIIKNTTECLLRIIDMDMVSLYGPMVECIRANGMKANNMGKVSILEMENLRKVCGSKANCSNGMISELFFWLSFSYPRPGSLLV